MAGLPAALWHEALAGNSVLKPLSTTASKAWAGGPESAASPFIAMLWPKMSHSKKNSKIFGAFRLLWRPVFFEFLSKKYRAVVSFWELELILRNVSV